MTHGPSQIEIVLPREISAFSASAICARLQQRDVFCNVHLAGNLDAGQMLDQAQHVLFVDAAHSDLALSMISESLADGTSTNSSTPRYVRATATVLVVGLIVLPLAISAAYALGRLIF